MIGLLVNNELERMWKEAAGTKFEVVSDICLDGLRKTTKKTSVIIAGLRPEL
jgi:hypothetical protein